MSDLCYLRKPRMSATIDLTKNRLDFYVKKNMKIVWNDNEEWAEFLCKRRNRLSGMIIHQTLDPLNLYKLGPVKSNKLCI